MNPTLDLSPWLSRPPRQLSNEELSALISLLAKNIRRNGVPRLHGLKPDIIKYPQLVKEADTWESELAKRIADTTFYSDKASIAWQFIGKESIEKRYGCKVVYAFYSGDGSFKPSLGKCHYRNDLAYKILAQTSLLSLYNKENWLIETSEKGDSDANKLYDLAKGILNTDERIFILPLHALVGDQEYFHGMIIAKLEKNRTLNEMDKAMLGHFVHHLGKALGNDKRYSFPANNDRHLQYVEQKLLDAPCDEPRKIFRTGQPAAPSIDLWCSEDHKGHPHGEFNKMIFDNIAWCRRSLRTKERNDLIPHISNVLRDIFNANESFFVEHKVDAGFKVIGKKPMVKVEKYENAVALSAMIGSPYQSADDNNAIIAIPHYTWGYIFIGTSVVCVSGSKPPLTERKWRQVLCFCHHVFNVLYTSTAEVSAEHYLNACPWHTYVDRLELPFNDNVIFPPFLSRANEDISKFGKKELEQTSGWLVDCLRQSGLPWGTELTYIEELKRHEKDDTAMELHQTTTTTIMDLCDRARKDDWQKTMKSVFGEVPKFFTGEKTHLLWLAVHQGSGRFKIYHSIKGELDEESTLVCEILAQLAAQRHHGFFMPSDDPDAYAKLLRSKIGDFSFIVMPIYGEHEVEVTTDGWHKQPGDLIGVFTLVTMPGRPEPTAGEWSRWGMFVPRLCLVMRKAKEAGKLNYCGRTPDLSEAAFIERMRLADL